MKQRSARPRLPFSGRTRVDPTFVERHLPGAKAAEAPQPVAALQEQTATAIVAPGHTLHIPVSDQKMVAGFDVQQARNVTRLRCRWAGPGTQVELPLSEIARLRKLGALLDPEGAAPPRIGPSTTTSPY
jgi:hypothetical protein